jgi:exodeoxyribonuclease V beta subunit
MPTLNIQTIPLSGNHLIEASAGTGKTYSITGIFLRMILERNMKPSQILILTFTEAAAAELKDRCRAVLRKALTMAEACVANPHFMPGENEDAFIFSVIQNQGNPAQAQTLLREALLDLDSADISTIHSFCQKALKRYAFETGQSFAQTLLMNPLELQQRCIAHYWRHHIPGKLIADIEAAELLNFELYLKGVLTGLRGNSLFIIDGALTAMETELETMITEVQTCFENRLKTGAYLTFDSMIHSLEACCTVPELQAQLRAQYQVLMVDEFQDTDKYQFAIFREIFQKSENVAVYYIGDPKQSIYAFRQADLRVYLCAKSSLDLHHIWTMDTNYRSTQALLHCLNDFFTPYGNFHPFAYDANQADRIEYHPVNAPELNLGSSPALTGCPDEPPLSIVYRNKDNWNAVIAELHRLLNPASPCRLEGNPVSPGDIAILLRTNAQCREMKKALAKHKIPAIVIDESSIYDSAEALSFQYLLQALLESSMSNLNTFLAEPVTSYKPSDLLNLDYDLLLPVFRKGSQIWHHQGLSAAIAYMFRELNIDRNRQTDPTTGHRILANFKQLTNLLQKQAEQAKLSPEEQLRYLEHQIRNAADIQEDEAIMQIESDAAAVRILTVHKSKGLEFPIVIVAAMELKNNPIHQYKYFTFNSDGLQRFVRYHTKLQEVPPYLTCVDLYKVQTEEENKRLIYVAMTRARYACTLVVIEGVKGSCIQAYLNALQARGRLTAYLRTLPPVSARWTYTHPAFIGSGATIRTFPQLQLAGRLEEVLSYSYLSGTAMHTPLAPAREVMEDPYEGFIFRELPKGVKTGNMIHELLEWIDFTDDKHWEKVIRRTFAKHYPSKMDNPEWRQHLKTLLTHIVQVQLQTSNPFSLDAISRTDRVNELDFHFPMPEAIQPQKIQEVLPSEDPRELQVISRKVNGFMTGFVDMVFVKDGKYYILDWKTNFLGDTLEYYRDEHLLHAMNAHNYHLQYLIYSVGLRRYLRKQLGTAYSDAVLGGVYYLFIRGMREGSTAGIYQVCPTRDELDRMEDFLCPQVPVLP